MDEHKHGEEKPAERLLGTSGGSQVAHGNTESKPTSDGARKAYVVERPQRRHMPQCARLVAQAFARKFAHVGMTYVAASAIHL